MLVGARDEARGAEKLAADGADACYVALDVTDGATVAAAARWITDEFGRLDMLVNNAGIALDFAYQGPTAVPVESVRTTYEANVFGVVAVTNAMLPLLREASAARIVSSELGSLTHNSDRRSQWWQLRLLGYNSSKAALNAVTVEYAKELDDTPIKINAVNPGYCATDLTNHQGHRTAAQGAAVAVRAATLPADGPSGAFLTEEGTLPW